MWRYGLLALLLPVTAVAAPLEVGLSYGEVGDLGDSLGFDVGWQATPRFRARLSIGELAYDRQRQVGDFSFNEVLEQQNTRLTLDWFPWRKSNKGNGFYGSVGFIQLGDPLVVDVTATEGLNYTLGNTQYSAGQLGVMTGEVQTQERVQYLGLGYQHVFESGAKGLYVQAEAGQVLGLDPELKLSTNNPAGLSNLPVQLQAVADSLNGQFEDSYTLYAISLGYRF